MDKKNKSKNKNNEHENADDESLKRKRTRIMKREKKSLEEDFELEEMMCDIEDDSLYYMIKNLRWWCD